nr:uncharacterized protein LOC100726696 isoform X2 [Cavia porcellus]
MGGCEVREFLWQFGFFLPLRTAWPGYCSHVSNNQVDLPAERKIPWGDTSSVTKLTFTCMDWSSLCLINGRVLSFLPFSEIVQQVLFHECLWRSD